MRHVQTPAEEVDALRFAPDGRSLYFLSGNPMDWSRLPSLLAGDPYNLFGTANVSSVQEFPGLYLHAYRIDTRTGAITGDWSFDGSEVAIFTPDLRSVYHSVSVAVAGGELDLRRLDLGTGEKVVVYESNVPYPSHVAFTPNGHILAIAGQHYAGDGRYCVHRLDVWHRTELDPIQIEAGCLAYSPSGHALATGNLSSGVQVWRGKVIAEQWPEPAAVLAWSPDGRLAWGMKERLAVVRPGSGDPLRAWTGTGGDVSALAFSPDGRRLLVGIRSGDCAFHDPAAGQQCAAFDWGIGPIHSVAFSPDGLTCAAGGENGQVVIWDVDA